MSNKIYGLLAEFDTPTEMVEAARKVRDAGYKKTDAFSPFPLHEIDEALGIKRSILPFMVFGGGLIGLLTGIGLQYFVHVFDYPIIVGGRPFFSLPSFIPVTYELTILLAAFTAVFGMIALNGLPQPYHPVFNVPRFALASREKFFLLIETKDAKFDYDETRNFMQTLNAQEVLMSQNSYQLSVVSYQLSRFGKYKVFCFLMIVACSLFAGCRYDMQDQPRYKAHKKSDFFKDGKAMRELPEGTVSRGNLREDKAFFTGKKENAGGAATPTAQTTTDGAGNSVVATFPDAIEEFPVPITEDLVNRGEQRYKVFCIVCHGPVGNGDGMIVRRGFPKPPTYNDDRLRNAPVGHFYDVITNGWGKMNSYASQVPPADRWAIVAYIRTLQISQNPNGNMKMTSSNTATNTAPATAATPALPNANAGQIGGARR